MRLARDAHNPAAEAHAQQLVEVSSVRLGIEVDRVASLELYRALGDDAGQARAANNLGRGTRRRGSQRSEQAT